MKWLRTHLREHITSEPEEYRIFLRALRDDGQLFVVWDNKKEATTPEILRLRLDQMLNDPAMAPYRDEETGEFHSQQIPLDSYKGHKGWIEEVV